MHQRLSSSLERRATRWTDRALCLCLCLCPCLWLPGLAPSLSVFLFSMLDDRSSASLHFTASDAPPPRCISRFLSFRKSDRVRHALLTIFFTSERYDMIDVAELQAFGNVSLGYLYA